ncbi:MAG TPA: adventurous gliding motility protein GltG [Anaeromyxobacteraceae bacterium]|nr:adventurous gliding motility protein GltG [Anaeromyxobacteraceae bacterium]
MPVPITLKVFRGEDLLRTEQFARDIIKIGRLSSAHLCLEDDRISRIHAVIEVAHGSVSIIDMGSAEGTFVNGKRVSRGPLRAGDEIGLGGLRILVDDPVVVRPQGAPANGAAKGGAANGAVPAAPAPPERVASAAAEAAPAAREVALTPAEAVPQAPKELEPSAAFPAAGALAPAAAPAERAAQAPARAVEAPRAARARPAASRARALDADPADASDRGAEVRVLWGETLLDAGTYLRPRRPVTVGTGDDVDFLLGGAELPAKRFPILAYKDGEYRFRFAKGMTGGLTRRGQEIPVARLVKERKAVPDADVEGVFSVALPPDGLAWAGFGSGLRVEAFRVRPERMTPAPWWERINYQFLNLFLVLLFLQGAFVVAATNFSREVDTVADDLFKNPQRMAKFIIKPPSEQPKSNPYLEKLQRELKKEQPGEMAERHKGEEGQMGKKDAPRTNARSAPRAIDPNAKDIVKNSGLVGLIGRGKGGGLSTIFGQGGLGGDLKGAVGNMFGPVVGDSYGVGGLGLKGTGTGGGGHGETIGIGGVGTKGRGGGLGGYGTGVGGLGHKADRDVAIQTGQVAVLGAIDKELIRRVIQEHASQIRYCYEQELQRDPKLEGKVVVRWIINADGHVSSPQIDGGATTLASDAVHRCMMDRIQSWEFPKPKGGGIAVITYPWILRASGGTGG